MKNFHKFVFLALIYAFMHITILAKA